MIYYVETNLIAIMVGIILLIHSLTTPSRLSTSKIVMRYMLEMLIFISSMDIIAYILRGTSYWGVEISNILYFLILAIGSYLWFLFILTKVEYVKHLRKTIICTSGPIVLLCIGFLFNPITGFFFTVDSEFYYHRGVGIPLTWIVEWLYMIAALVINIVAIVKEKTRSKRYEYIGYVLFMIPMTIAAAVQMAIYGTTTTQVGFMIAVLMAYLNSEHYQVHRDDLTGLNNKNAFLTYRDSLVSRVKAVDLVMLMIDADYFKQINDKYGHLKGDQALRDIASALSSASYGFNENILTLYRYAGDEFVIVGNSISDEDVNRLIDSINKEIDIINDKNQSNGELYKLSLSIGYARKECNDCVDFDELLKLADEKMYSVKSGKNANR